MEAYPLQWPIGYKRTHYRSHSKFKQGMEASQRFLRAEIDRLGGTNLIVSSNIPVRKDGGLYTDYMSRKLDDPGVAIYFKYKKQEISMCCDRYLAVWENIYALGKGIEALRGMDRWGVSDFLERAFTGFKELATAQPMKPKTWYEILGLTESCTAQQIKDEFRSLSKRYHPDNQETGNAELFIQVKAAAEEGLRLR